MTTRTKPPFRADHVGSLLRSAKVRDARAARAEGKMSAADLKEVEDEGIIGLIEKQKSIGLKDATDGEYRRAAWQWDFFEGLDGVESSVGEAAPFKGAPAKARVMKVTGKLGFSAHPMIEHFKFLKQHTSTTPKMTIPSPTMLVSAMRDWRDIVDRSVYPTLEEFYRDLAKTYQQVVAGFAAAGCRYLQLDDCNLSYLCDPTARQKITDRGDDPDKTLSDWADLINTSISKRPSDMTITTHICRGNFRSNWLASGGYEPVAETLFGKIGVDGFFLEYDSERAGGFEPLRHASLAKNKMIVLGLITTKTGELEKPDVIKRRIDDAAKFVDADRLCLSPQCGFASTEEGNVLSENEQWAKLAMAVKIADEVWGSA